MTEYRAGHLKHNVELGEVAIRTTFPLDQGINLAAMAWLVAGKSSGARTARMEEIDGVEGWDDLYVPPAPESPMQMPPPAE